MGRAEKIERPSHRGRNITLVLFMLGLGAVVAASYPELKRYLRIRSM